MSNQSFTVNDGNGLFDKYGLIKSCIDDLCAIKIRVDELATNGVKIVDVINRLQDLGDGLQKEEKMEKQEDVNDGGDNAGKIYQFK